MNFVEITPQAMLNRLSTLSAERPEIETLTYILGPERILEWLHSAGVSTDRELRDLAPPVPPFELRSIVAAPSESVFLWSGLKDAELCADYVDRYVELTPAARACVLDFGCGCGRTTRFLQAISRFDLYGTDVNRRLVSWCRDNLKSVTTTDNPVAPPLKYKEGRFDFIYSLSIFTHLPEKSMIAWLDELARVTASGGFVLVTTHGYPALETICRSSTHQAMFRLSAKEAELLRSALDNRRYCYRPYGAETVAVAKAGEDYGNSFIHESYIRDHWTRGVFDVVEFVPGGLRGWQDVTILRRRARVASGAQ
jgi:SAM-dependent methyltransferase